MICFENIFTENTTHRCICSFPCLFYTPIRLHKNSSNDENYGFSKTTNRIETQFKELSRWTATKKRCAAVASNWINILFGLHCAVVHVQPLSHDLYVRCVCLLACCFSLVVLSNKNISRFGPHKKAHAFLIKLTCWRLIEFWTPCEHPQCGPHIHTNRYSYNVQLSLSVQTYDMRAHICSYFSSTIFSLHFIDKSWTNISSSESKKQKK